MAALHIVLTPIALLDSTSIIPLCLVLLVVLLAGPRPFLISSGLILGVFAVYYACGLLLLLGLQSVFDQINAYAVRLWQDPDTEELIFQIVVGIVSCGFALRIARTREQRGERPASGGMTPVRAFVAGAGLTIVAMPTAVPYFAAIDLILRAEVALLQRVAALLYYNLVFVVPLVAIVALPLIFGERGSRVLSAIKRFFDRWGQRVMVALFMILGVVLAVDGVGWFLGYPLIPV